MADITVNRNEKKKDTIFFDVEVVEGDSKTTHKVELTEHNYDRITGRKITPEELVEKSFEFLLERETKEAILSRFNLAVISSYFPEYEREIKTYF